MTAIWHYVLNKKAEPGQWAEIEIIHSGQHFPGAALEIAGRRYVETIVDVVERVVTYREV